MSTGDDYVNSVMKKFKWMAQGVEGSLLWGSQPFELKKFEGGACPMCGGRGKDDGGPGPWTCGTCGGSGRLGKVWLESYLPYPEGHPFRGTDHEAKGWKA